MNLAHVRWFVDSDVTVEMASITWHEFLFVIAGVGAFLGVIRWISLLKVTTNFFKWCDKKFKKAASWVPTLTRLSLGALLVINSWNQYFYAPNIEITSDYQQFISWLLGGLGVLLLMGILVRSASLTLAIIYLFSLFAGEPLLVLEHIEYLGLAGYLALVGGGEARIRIMDQFDINELEKYKVYAQTILRIGVGVGLSILALSEKLLNFSDAQQFLNSYDWNFLSSLGVEDRLFIIIAGLIELGVGLSLIFNIATRLTTLMVLLLFITTAILLGVDEIIGHMFAVGLVLAVWVNYPVEKSPLFKKESVRNN